MSTETTSPSIETFVDRLIEEKGLNGLDAEVLEQVKKDLSDRIEDRINAAVLAHLPSDKAPEFSKILETADAGTIQAFIVASVPNINDVVGEALTAFRTTYLNG